MHSFAFKNLWSKRTRSFLALVGLSIAIVGVIGLISISSGIRMSIVEGLSKMQGVIVLQKDVLIPTTSSVLAEYEDKIAQIPEVSATSPEVWAFANTLDEEGTMQQGLASAVMMIGIDPSKTAKFRGGGMYNQNLKKGRFLKGGDRYVAVISKAIADQTKKSVGSVIKLNDKKFSVVGIFETGSTALDNHVIIPTDIAREFAGYDRDHVTAIFAEVKNPADADAVAKKVEFLFDDVSAKSGSEYSQEVSSIVSQLDVFFLVISMVAVVVGAIGILNTMLMSVMERVKEFGILRAIGWTRDDVRKLIMFESLYLGVIGGVLGVALGYLSSIALGWVLPFKPVATGELLAFGFALAIALGVVGGLYPAWRASKLDPITAIRYG